MSAFTIALLIWLTLWVIFSLSGVSNTFAVLSFALAHAEFGLWIFGYVFETLATILFILAIVGIISHYYSGENASPLRWGPLCGIAGTAAQAAGLVIASYYGTPMPSYSPTATALFDVLVAYVIVIITGVPSYIEYLKEGASEATEHVAQVVRSEQLSTALARHIEDIEVSIEQVRKRVRRDLTLLTVALPIIFVGAISITVQAWLLTIIYALFGAFFLIVAVAFSSLLKKPRFVLLSVNQSDAGLDSIAEAERRTLVKDAREQLTVFLLVYAFPVLFWMAALSQRALRTEVNVSFSMLLLSALVCFLFGYWVLTRSRVAAIALNEPALHGLLGASVGVLPTKVRAGEAHSVLMDFNIAAASGGAQAAVLIAPPNNEIFVPENKIFGRDDFAQYVPFAEANQISRKQFRISRTGRQFFIEDLASTGGTRVDGTRIRPNTKVVLTHGSKITLPNEMTLLFTAKGAMQTVAPVTTTRTPEGAASLRRSAADATLIEASSKNPASATTPLRAKLVGPGNAEMYVPGSREFGRDDFRSIVSDDKLPFISRRHFAIQVSGDAYSVEDLRSNNGTMLNGAQLQPGVRQTLKPGDKISCGNVLELEFQSSPALGAGSPRPHYEVELQAAGATVEGEKRCVIFDVPATFKGVWNCLFPSAGNHVLHLVLNEVRPARAQTAGDAFVREPLFTYVHNVRVDGRFTASSDNAVSMTSIIVTVVSVLTTLLRTIAVH
jgi:pSer/pThr/pTyr-binding forkhead associated (FHA) protein